MGNRKITNNDLAALMMKLEKEIKDTKEEMMKINMKLDRLMTQSAAHQGKISDLCSNSQKQALRDGAA